MVHDYTIRAQIHDHLVGNFLFDGADVKDDASLMDEGILDSTGVLEMVLFVEETFGIAVSEDDVAPENFDSINALVAFVMFKGLLIPQDMVS